MTTKTDFQSIRELKEAYTPAQRGIVNSEEAATIRRVLELESRTPIELCNIRDMVVMFYDKWSDRCAQRSECDKSIQCMDAMSAITCIIDQEKFTRGMEV